MAAGFMTHVTCRLTAKNRDQLRSPTLGNRVSTTVILTSFVGGECINVGRRTVKLGIRNRHTSTDVRERPEVIEAMTKHLLTYLFHENDQRS